MQSDKYDYHRVAAMPEFRVLMRSKARFIAASHRILCHLLFLAADPGWICTGRNEQTGLGAAEPGGPADAEDKWLELEVRDNTGLGSEKATVHDQRPLRPWIRQSTDVHEQEFPSGIAAWRPEYRVAEWLNYLNQWKR